jgi:plastocyanin
LTILRLISGISLVFLSLIALFSVGIDQAFAAEVRIPQGTSVEGCEENNQCYDPYVVVIHEGETVTWVNEDTEMHTVTSGIPLKYSGEFDSSVYLTPGSTFEHEFETTGDYNYHCTFYPWMEGIVRVIEADSEEITTTQEQDVIENESSLSDEQHSAICGEDELSKILGPIQDINRKYKAGLNIMVREIAKAQGFEEYLEGIDYKKSEKVSSYVDSILESTEYAVFYFEKDLSPEEEKLMIQVSEKYLEFLYDGKNRLISYIKTEYSERKDVINSIPMQDSRTTICGDDKIEGLEELKEDKKNFEMAVDIVYMPIIEEWEKNLQIKQNKLETESSEKIEKTATKPQSETIKNVVSGDLSLKKGDWVKYEMTFEGEGGFASFLDIAKSAYEDPETGCTFSDIEWIKFEITGLENNIPSTKNSVYCNDNEIEKESMGESFESNLYYIPTDVNIGEIIVSPEKEFEVLGFEEKNYGEKTAEVIKVYFEEVDMYENGGKMTITDELFFEKESGILLERQMIMEAKGVPLFGEMVFQLGYNAIDYNVPRTSVEKNASGDEGGGCLIATATYGSELAPQVQNLRELRDSKLLQTESGSAFMASFNNFYYSFSPTIADLERENPYFKEGVKLAITPMISSLSILNYVDMNTESEVLGYGIPLILLNVGMYVGVPIAIFIGIRKQF